MTNLPFDPEEVDGEELDPFSGVLNTLLILVIVLGVVVVVCQIIRLFY